MKDLIAGCFNYYSPSALSFWVNSIEKSGFDGDKLAIVYGRSTNENVSATFLKNKGWIVEQYDAYTKSVVVSRFRDIASFLSHCQGKYRYVISTDAGDVVFQTNPSLFLEEHLKNKQILVGSECLLYRDELAWGRTNMLSSFPSQAKKMMDKLIMNAGTVAATATMAISLFQEVFDLSMTSSIVNPDQAALNILLYNKYKEQTFFAKMEEGWAIQCNTVLNPILLAIFGNFLVEKEYSIDKGIAYNKHNQKFCIVHQYNSVPGLREAMNYIYG